MYKINNCVLFMYSSTKTTHSDNTNNSFKWWMRDHTLLAAFSYKSKNCSLSLTHPFDFFWFWISMMTELLLILSLIISFLAGKINLQCIHISFYLKYEILVINFKKILIRIWTVTILQTKYIIKRFCQSDALWDLHATLSVVKKAVYNFQCLKIQKQTYMRKMNEAEIFCAWFADMLGSTKMSTYQNTCSNEWCNSIMKSFAATFLNNICTCRFNFHIRKKTN